MASQGLVQGSVLLVEQIGTMSLQVIDLNGRLKETEAKASDLALKLGEAEARIKDLTACDAVNTEQEVEKLSEALG